MTTKRKSQTDGADVVRALGFLVDAGHPLPAIALACEVSTRTVVKWFCGTTRPNYANFETLRSVVSERYTRLLARHDIRTPRVAHEIDLFEKITDALMTNAERRADAELVERMTAGLEAAQSTEPPSGYAGREGYRSVTRDVDPFELITKSRKPEPHIPF